MDNLYYVNLSLYNIRKDRKVTLQCRIENLWPHPTLKGATVFKWMYIYPFEVYQGHLCYINIIYSNLLQRIRRITVYGRLRYSTVP